MIYYEGMMTRSLCQVWFFFLCRWFPV